MATGGHFETKSKTKLRIDLKWREMRSKVIFGHPKWLPAAILKKKSNKKEKLRIWNGEICDRKWFSVIQNGRFVKKITKKIKVVYWSEMARNAIESDFRSSKMAAGSHLVNKKSCVFIWICEKCDRKWFSVIQNGRRQPFCVQNQKN